jgi:hypothetical protein
VVSIGNTRVSANDIRTGITLEGVGAVGAFVNEYMRRTGSIRPRLTLVWDRVGRPLPGAGLSSSFRGAEVRTTVGISPRGYPMLVYEAVGALAGGRRLELEIRLEAYSRPEFEGPLRIPAGHVGVLVALFTSALATGYMVLGPRPALPVALRSRGW